MTLRRTTSFLFGTLLVLGPAALAADPGADEGVAVEVHRLLAESGDDWPAVPRLQDTLVALGTEAVPELLEVLAERTISPPDGDARPRRLDRKRELAVSGALERLPRGVVLSALERTAAESSAVRERVVALELAGRLGRSSHVQLLLDLASPGDGFEGARELRPVLREALRRLLRREPRALAALGRRLAEVPPGLFGEVVAAVGDLATTEALAVLANGLGRVPARDALILVEVRHLVAAGVRADARVTWSLRESLRSADGSVLVLSILTLQDLLDRESVPGVIDCLDHPETQVRDAAHAALRELTGLISSSGSEEWRSWYEGELRWLRTEGAALEAALGGANEEDALAAVQELAGHPVLVTEFGPSLVSAMDRPEPRVVALACAALGQLRERSALTGLIGCLEHADPRVRRAAHGALAGITGLDLPADAAVWRMRLGRQEDS